MPAFLLPALMGGARLGSSLMGWLGRRRMPAFNQTARGRYLEKLRATGKYSPETQGKILGEVSSQAGNVAQQRTADIGGYLEARGMGGSVAGARLLASPGQERQRMVSEATRGLQIENEESKARAEEAYAREATGYMDARAAEKAAGNRELAEGIGGAGMTAVQTYLGEKERGAREGLESRKLDIDERQVSVMEARDMAIPDEMALKFSEDEALNFIARARNEREADYWRERFIKLGVLK